MFDKYRFNGYFQFLFDGTGLSNHNYNLNDNCLLNAFKHIETKKNKTITFRYISNLNIKDTNIGEIVTMGRIRWKIENEGFASNF